MGSKLSVATLQHLVKEDLQAVYEYAYGTTASSGEEEQQYVVRILLKEDLENFSISSPPSPSQIQDLCGVDEYLASLLQKSLAESVAPSVSPAPSYTSRGTELVKELLTALFPLSVPWLAELDRAYTLPEQKAHVNLAGVIAVVETKRALYFLSSKSPINLRQLLAFNPTALTSDIQRKFVLYQLLNGVEFCHRRGMPHGNIKPDTILMSQSLWTSVSNPTCGFGDAESLRQCCTMRWVHGEMSNFSYLMYLNSLAGRRSGDAMYHPIVPWVSDLTSSNGGWRDLTKTKYRLSKGDEMLDITYHSGNPHHLTDLLSSVTFCIYAARRIPIHVLRRVVRSKFEPNEYPGSIQRMYQWTPDECIPEFYTDPGIFRSEHSDMVDLGVPDWATTPEDFVKQHKAMLESDVVSAQLHRWIDLAFGYQLSGQAAIDAKNVTLTKDLKSLTTFGSLQLFHTAHPARKVSLPTSDKTASALRLTLPDPIGDFVDPHRPRVATIADGVEASPSRLLHSQAQASPPVTPSMLNASVMAVLPSTPSSGSTRPLDSAGTAEEMPEVRVRVRAAASLMRIQLPAHLTDDTFLSDFKSEEILQTFCAQHAHLLATYKPPTKTTFADDVFSIGAIAAHLFAGTPVLTQQNSAAVLRRGYLAHPLLPSAVQRFVEKLTRLDPAERSQAHTLVRDEFFPNYFPSVFQFLASFENASSMQQKMSLFSENLNVLVDLPSSGFQLIVPAYIDLLHNAAVRATSLKHFDTIAARLGRQQSCKILGATMEKLLNSQDDEPLQMILLDPTMLALLLRRLGVNFIITVVMKYILHAIRMGGNIAAAAARAATSCAVQLGPITTLRHITPPLLRAVSRAASAVPAADALAGIATTLGEVAIIRCILPHLVRFLHSTSPSEAVLLPVLALVNKVSSVLSANANSNALAVCANGLASLLRDVPSSEAILERLASAVVTITAKLSPPLVSQHILTHVAEFFRAYDVYHACCGRVDPCNGSYRNCCMLCKTGSLAGYYTPGVLLFLYERLCVILGRDVVDGLIPTDRFVIHVITAHAGGDDPETIRAQLSETVAAPVAEESSHLNWDSFPSPLQDGAPLNGWDFQGQVLHTLRNHTGAIRGMAVSDNERLLVTAGKDSFAKVWNVDRGNCLTTYRGHTEALVGVAFVDGQNTVATCDKLLQIWDCESSRRRYKFRGSALSAFCCVNPNVIIGGTAEGSLRVMDIREGQQLQEWKLLTAGAIIRTVSAHEGSNRIAVGLSSGSMLSLDCRMGTVLDHWKGHSDAVQLVESLPHSRMISCSADKSLCLWDTNQVPASAVSVYKGHSDPVTSFVVANESSLISAAGSRVAIAPLDAQGQVKITNFKQLWKMPTLRGGITTLTFLPFAQILLAGSDDGQVRYCI